jgi:large subunit ribosomal protein L3
MDLLERIAAERDCARLTYRYCEAVDLGHASRLADVFAADGDTPVKVDVVATSKGHGFSGVMKRHGFSGLGAGHGVERKHRSPGSIGACATPSRVFKGVRMAGRHGGVKTTTLNLVVHSVDAEKGVILIKGAVPGPVGGLVLVRSAAKAPLARGSRGGA